MGNRRTTCNTCNNFAANSRRVSLKRMVEQFPEEYAQVRARVEADLYVELVERYARETYGVSRETFYTQGVDNSEEPTPEEAWAAFTSSFSGHEQTDGNP